MGIVFEQIVQAHREQILAHRANSRHGGHQRGQHLIFRERARTGFMAPGVARGAEQPLGTSLRNRDEFGEGALAFRTERGAGLLRRTDQRLTITRRPFKRRRERDAQALERDAQLIRFGHLRRRIEAPDERQRGVVGRNLGRARGRGLKRTAPPGGSSSSTPRLRTASSATASASSSPEDDRRWPGCGASRAPNASRSSG